MEKRASCILADTVDFEDANHPRQMVKVITVG